MEKFTVLQGIAAPLLRTNVDTGSIIASVWLRSRSIDLGAKLFNDWRYDLDGNENPDFVLNRPRYRNCRILLSGPYFGCGSSREGAVWALMRYGIRCVIAPSYGEIFFDNACQNGLLPIVLPEAGIERIAATLESASSPAMTVSLIERVIVAPDATRYSFEIADDRRMALIEGLDETSLILRYAGDIAAYCTDAAAKRPWLHRWAPLDASFNERESK